MPMKYWRLKLRGERAMDDIHSAVGASGANIVRIHVGNEETHVYIASDDPRGEHRAGAMKDGGEYEEVTLAAVTTLD